MKKQRYIDFDSNLCPPSLREELSFYKLALKPFFWRFVSVILMMVLIWVGACISPVLQKYLVNNLVDADRTGVIIFGILTAFALCVARGGATFQNLMSSMLSVKVGAYLKKLFFRHLLQLPLGVVESAGSGYFGQRMHLDIDLAAYFLSNGIFQLGLNLLKLCGALILLCFYAPRMMFATCPVLLVFLVMTWFFRRRQFALSSRISEATAEYRRLTQNSLDRLTLFKSRASESRVDHRLSRNLKKLTMLRISRLRWERFYTFLLQLLPAAWSAVIWSYGAWKVIEKSWTLGDLWAVSGYLLLIFSPGKLFFTGLLNKRNSDAAIARLIELRKMLPEKSAVGEQKISVVSNNGIDFDGISFAYPGGRKVFDNFSLSVAPGEHVGITGPSGGGKSTLGALLLRLYDVSVGEIRLGGVPLRQYPLKVLRRSIGYIGQSAELFYASVRENLSHGTSYSDAKLIEALKKAGMEERLKDNPDLLDLHIREDGGNFSAGERLKLALARELLRKTRVLVLDEATSALDRESEKKVLSLLHSEWKEYTVLFISHRNFDSGQMDRIIEIGRN